MATDLTVQVQGQTVLSADRLNTYVQSTDLVADLYNFIGISQILVMVRGLNAVGDGGGGLFYWNATSRGPSDDINVIQPSGASVGAWIRFLPSGAFGPQSDIDCAATVDIGATGSANIYVTNSTGNVTSFGTSARTLNPLYVVRFDGVATIKNSASIICPGGNDITTATNDIYLVVCIAPGTYVVTPMGGVSNPATYPGFGSQNDLAAATTTDLGSIATHNVLVTGSGVSITSFGATAVATAPIYLVQFADVNTLVYDATAMILIGGADIVTEAGDVALMAAKGSGDFEMLMYQRASGGGLAETGSFHSQIVAANGNFTIPAGFTADTQLKCRVIGGGGGGGGASTTNGAAAGGGSSGDYIEAVYKGFVAGQNITVVVGAAGAGGANTGGNGGNGSSTTLSYNSVVIATASPGGGGTGSTGLGNVRGGLGGGSSAAAGASGLTLVSSTINPSPPLVSGSYVAGSVGIGTSSSSSIGGMGGGGVMGYGGYGGFDGSPSPGYARGYGGGGGGACRVGGSNLAGGAGTAGAVIFEWVL